MADADEVVGDHFAEPEDAHGHVAGIFVGLLTVGAEDGGGVVDVDGQTGSPDAATEAPTSKLKGGKKRDTPAYLPLMVCPTPVERRDPIPFASPSGLLLKGVL